MVEWKKTGQAIALSFIAISSVLVLVYVYQPYRLEVTVFLQVQIFATNGVIGGNGGSYVINDTLRLTRFTQQPMQPYFRLERLGEHIIVPGWRDPNLTLLLLVNLTLVHFGISLGPSQAVIPFTSVGTFVVAVTFPFANVSPGDYKIIVSYSAVFNCRFKQCARLTTLDSWNSTATIY